MQKEITTKKRIFDIISIGHQEDFPSRFFDYFIVTVIFLNITAMLLETFDSLANLRGLFRGIEIATVLVFCVEYILRIWTAEYLYPGETRKKAILKFLRSYDGVVDLLTILPFFFLSGFVAFRMLRVVRIFHLFRINAQYDSFNVIKAVIYEKRNQLASSVFIITVLMVASSLFMYSAEHEAQPENFKNAFSGIWWSMSTLLTVGYGDIYPVTSIGRAMAIVIAFLGVGSVAIPTGIISAGFVEQYSKMQHETPRLTENIKTILIQVDSAWIGKSVFQVETEFDIDIVLIKRDGRTTVPRNAFRVQLNDEIAYLRVEDEQK